MKDYVYIVIEENDLECETYSEVILVTRDPEKAKKEIKARAEVAKKDLNITGKDGDYCDVQETKFYIENKTSTITGRIEKQAIQ